MALNGPDFGDRYNCQVVDKDSKGRNIYQMIAADGTPVPGTKAYSEQTVVTLLGNKLLAQSTKPMSTPNMNALQLSTPVSTSREDPKEDYMVVREEEGDKDEMMYQYNDFNATYQNEQNRN